jgi:Secretion system C-terminal sorting domain
MTINSINKMKKSPAFILIAFFIIFPFTQISAQYISSTTVQVGSPSIYPGQLTESILRIEIEIGNNPVTLTNMTFNTNGATFPTNDIVRAQLWQYNDTAILNTTFGLLIGTFNAPWNTNFEFLTAPNANYSGMSSYSGMTPAKKNYFWLVFDISAGAIPCDSIDAEFIEFNTDGTIQYPAISAPAGFRVVGICPTGVNEDAANPEITVFPVPCTDELKVSFDAQDQESVRIELYSVTGKRVATLFDGVADPNASEFKFSVTNYPPGVYYMNVISGKEISTKKIMKL